MDLTQIYYLQEIGGKKNQEDYIWPIAGSASLQDKVFIVCDGVGGSENGEIASRIISESVGKAILESGTTEISSDLVNDLLNNAQQELVQYARENGLNTDMATTFTLLVLSARKAFLAWCGDSRIYHIRKGKILYKTSDHSLVNSLVKSGEITEDEALVHPRKNIILKAIKADESIIEADYHIIEDIRKGDYFLLCTDGFLEKITEGNLKFLLKLHDEEALDLVARFQSFCFGKTKDNYSMYLLKVSLENTPAQYKKKIITLVIFFALLIAASVFVLSQYFAKKQQVIDPNTVKPVNSGKESGMNNRMHDSLISKKNNLPVVRDGVKEQKMPEKKNRPKVIS